VKIILSNDVEALGKKGDVVVVKDGYARNFLMPKGLAIPASRGALKQAELMQKARLDRDEKAKAEAAAKVAHLASSPVYISARAGEGGRLFGSVTNADIARAVLDQLEEDIDRRDVRMDDAIRSLGTHQIEVKLHEEVNALITVEVIAHEEEEA
jgi:large subunit ribosomal protein L9